MEKARGLAWFRGVIGALGVGIALGGCAQWDGTRQSPTPQAANSDPAQAAAVGEPIASSQTDPSKAAAEGASDARPAPPILRACEPPPCPDAPATDPAGRLAARQQFAAMPEPTGAPLIYRDEAVATVTPVAAEEVAAPQGTPPSTAESPWNVQAIQSPGTGTGSPEPASTANSVRLIPLPGDEKRITLHIDDLDVRKALEMLSRQTSMSMAVSPGVSGRVTLDLRDKTVGEALDTIARLCHLTIRRERSITYVSTLADQRQTEEDHLPIRVYHLNYVRSTDLEAMIRPLLSDKGQLTTSPDSERGIAANTDKAGGNLMAGGEVVVVQDYEQQLRTIDRVVAQIDVQPIEVLIEAVIVQVTLTKETDLGVNYAILDNSGRALGVVGNGSVLNSAAGFTPASVLAGAGAVLNSVANVTTTTAQTGQPTATTSTTTANTSTNGQVASGFAQNNGGVKFGFTGRNITGFITALQTIGDTKVLAAPRLLVLNKQRAEISLGNRLGYATVTQNSTSTTQQVNFLDTGTLLRLRPFVSSDGIIRMEIHPERSSGALDANGIPQTSGTQVTSNIMIPDGTTIVIGGLIDTEIDKTVSGIPVLMDLPILGALFRQTTDTTTKKELVVILTPYICRPECPGATNYLGDPRALGLGERANPTPLVEKGYKKDSPNLLELTRPNPPAQHVPLPPDSGFWHSLSPE